MKIYIFGDSFSVDYDMPCLAPQGLEYCKWKGYKPKKYYDLLKEKYLATDIINFSLCGNDNENIFESFTETYNEIGKDDMVIFGWTMLHRFSICNNKRPGDQNINLWGSSVSYNEFDWVVRTGHNKSTILYYNRQMKLINFIDTILKTNKVIHWCWEYTPSINTDKTISHETNGVVDDYHYNEKMHKELYEKMLIEFENSNHISIDLWDPKILSKNNLALDDLT